MQFYSFHPETNEFLGVGQADPDPMNEGEFLYPAFTTRVAPPEPIDGHVFLWLGQWVSVVDCRGETWWPVSQQYNMTPGVVIDFIGDPLNHGFTHTEPPAPPEPEPAPISVSPAQIRIALSRIGLRAEVEAYVAASDDQDIKDMWQFATSFERNNAMIAAAADYLGKSPDEIDALFALAQSV